MKDFKDKKVVIMGLGLHGGGASAAKFFCREGAKVLVTDLKKEEDLSSSLQKLKNFPIRYVLGRHREKDFAEADLIIKNPGVPEDSSFLDVAWNNNIPVETDVNIFFDLTESLIIGVTGTKGKSTISTFIYEILKKEKEDVFLAGNIGVSPLEILPEVKKESWVVLELSSFELEYLRRSPQVAVVCSIYPDHLNRYPNMGEYIEAKKKIYKYQDSNDFLILNYDDPLVKEMGGEGQTFFYSKEQKPLEGAGCFLKENKFFFDDEKDALADVKDLRIKGEHNVSNALAALTVAKIMKIPKKKIEEGLSAFSGVKDREEVVLEKEGIRYVNDTTATIPEAVISALRRYEKSEIILIAGGEDKGLEYGRMAEKIDQRVKSLILLPGSASEEIKKKINRVDSILVNSMEEAVRRAHQKALKGDIVLMSPGAASFNLFNNEFDRGEQFIKNVNKMANG